MTKEEARESLLRDFHKTRVTEKVFVSAEALGVLLYGTYIERSYNDFKLKTTSI